MSLEQEVAKLVQEARGDGEESVAGALAEALKEVHRLLEVTGDSLQAICASIEGAASQDDLRTAFTRLDKIVRIFVGIAPGDKDQLLVREALSKLQLSDRLLKSIRACTSPRKGILAYKRSIIKDLALLRQRQDAQAILDEKVNNQLFAQFFPVKE